MSAMATSAGMRPASPSTRPTVTNVNPLATGMSLTLNIELPVQTGIARRAAEPQIAARRSRVSTRTAAPTQKTAASPINATRRCLIS